MTAAMIPSNFVRRVRQHLRRTGLPLVYSFRRQADIGLLAVQNPASARWALVTDTSTLPDILEEAILGDGPSTDLMLRLTKYAAIAVDGLPSRFECEGMDVGHMEVCDGVPLLSDAVALSCFSFLLRHHEPRTGFFIRVVEAQLPPPRGR